MACLPVAWHLVDGGKESPLAPGSGCVIGNLSAWFQNVTQPDVLYEETRFLEDPHYAYFMANLNLFSYLVAHHDGKSSNYLRSKEKARPRFSRSITGSPSGPGSTTPSQRIGTSFAYRPFERSQSIDCERSTVRISKDTVSSLNWIKTTKGC